MTRDEIIRMAREAGLPETEREGIFIVNSDDLGRMLAAEREACAQMCDEIANKPSNMVLGVALDCAASIRARGKK